MDIKVANAFNGSKSKMLHTIAKKKKVTSHIQREDPNQECGNVWMTWDKRSKFCICFFDDEEFKLKVHVVSRM